MAEEGLIDEKTRVENLCYRLIKVPTSLTFAIEDFKEHSVVQICKPKTAGRRRKSKNWYAVANYGVMIFENFAEQG
jgi:hypothetical protein